MGKGSYITEMQESRFWNLIGRKEEVFRLLVINDIRGHLVQAPHFTNKEIEVET